MNTKVLKFTLLGGMLLPLFTLTHQSALAESDKSYAELPKKSVDGSAVAVSFSSKHCDLTSFRFAQKRGEGKLGKKKSISINTEFDSDITKVKKLAPGNYIIVSVDCQTGIGLDMYGVSLESKENPYGSFTVKAGEITYLGDVDFQITSPEGNPENPLSRTKKGSYLLKSNNAEIFITMIVSDGSDTAYDAISKKKRKKGLPPMTKGLVKLIEGPLLSKRFG